MIYAKHKAPQITCKVLAEFISTHRRRHDRHPAANSGKHTEQHQHICIPHPALAVAAAAEAAAAPGLLALTACIVVLTYEESLTTIERVMMVGSFAACAMRTSVSTLSMRLAQARGDHTLAVAEAADPAAAAVAAHNRQNLTQWPEGFASAPLVSIAFCVYRCIAMRSADLYAVAWGQDDFSADGMHIKESSAIDPQLLPRDPEFTTARNRACGPRSIRTMELRRFTAGESNLTSSGTLSSSSSRCGRCAGPRAGPASQNSASALGRQ